MAEIGAPFQALHGVHAALHGGLADFAMQTPPWRMTKEPPNDDSTTKSKAPPPPPPSASSGLSTHPPPPPPPVYPASSGLASHTPPPPPPPKRPREQTPGPEGWHKGNKIWRPGVHGGNARYANSGGRNRDYHRLLHKAKNEGPEASKRFMELNPHPRELRAAWEYMQNDRAQAGLPCKSGSPRGSKDFEFDI